MSDPEQKGKRKILHAASLTQELIDELAADLEDGWFFDPWLNPPGHPIIVASESSFAGFYWVLVKGSPEQIAELNPFVELPAVEEPGPESKPYGLETMFIAHGEKDAEGNPKKPPAGFVIMHKDHIYAKGTVYTLRPSEETSLKAPQPISSP